MLVDHRLPKENGELRVVEQECGSGPRYGTIQAWVNVVIFNVELIHLPNVNCSLGEKKVLEMSVDDQARRFKFVYKSANHG